MLFFGYIVTDVKYKDLDEDVVKIVSSIDECYKRIPKLIIGLDNAKKYALDNGWKFDILEHTFPNNDMWTFKKTEKREFYEEDIKLFKKKVVELQGNDLTYYYVNIYSLKYTKIKKLYNILLNNELNKLINYIIVDRNMIYAPIDNNKVIGLSISHLEYLGIDRNKIIEKLKSCCYNKIYFTTSKNMWKLKDWFYGREYVIASIFERNAKKHN